MILPMRRTPSWALERMMSSGVGWSTRLSLDVLLVSPSLSGLYLTDDEVRWEMRADWKQLFMFFLIARIASRLSHRTPSTILSTSIISCWGLMYSLEKCLAVRKLAPG